MAGAAGNKDNNWIYVITPFAFVYVRMPFWILKISRFETLHSIRMFTFRIDVFKLVGMVIGAESLHFSFRNETASIFVADSVGSV